MFGLHPSGQLFDRAYIRLPNSTATCRPKWKLNRPLVLRRSPSALRPAKTSSCRHRSRNPIAASRKSGIHPRRLRCASAVRAPLRERIVRIDRASFGFRLRFSPQRHDRVVEAEACGTEDRKSNLNGQPTVAPKSMHRNGRNCNHNGHDQTNDPTKTAAQRRTRHRPHRQCRGPGAPVFGRTETGRHLHPCAVISYIVAGAAIVQIEGEAAHTVAAGAVVYEPANRIIARFDNTSVTEPLKFIAYYLRQGVS